MCLSDFIFFPSFISCIVQMKSINVNEWMLLWARERVYMHTLYCMTTDHAELMVFVPLNRIHIKNLTIHLVPSVCPFSIENFIMSKVFHFNLHYNQRIKFNFENAILLISCEKFASQACKVMKSKVFFSEFLLITFLSVDRMLI